MAQSLADIIIHVIFSTKDRNPWIQPDVDTELYSYIHAVCHNLNCLVIQINGISDHIHILLSLDKTITISKLIAEIKSNSSYWIKTKGKNYEDFAWQNGYGAFSVSRPNIDGVIKYIALQKEHHKTMTFQEELLSLLKRAKIKYDEQYLWT